MMDETFYKDNLYYSQESKELIHEENKGELVLLIPYLLHHIKDQQIMATIKNPTLL